MKRLFVCFLFAIVPLISEPKLIVLGTAQDAGYPHAGCMKSCCEKAWNNPEMQRCATSLAVFDNETGERWLFDASPDLKVQLYSLDQVAPRLGRKIFSGIFLTHAHVGHYLGLYHLGREVMGTKEVTVFAMEKMCQFLSNNGPWDQLVKLKNISLCQMNPSETIPISKESFVEPLLVPHRGEYTETVGFIIHGPHKSILFIPDIDSWDEWEVDINELIKSVDIAFLDGTFFDENELPGRNLSEIPHPLVKTSLDRFSKLSPEGRNKVYFIHLNHSNPLLWDQEKVRDVQDLGFHVATQGQIIDL